MKNKTFDEGMILLSTVFKGIDFARDTLRVYNRLLNDLDDENFEQAIIKICKELKEIYPGTNLIALIRETVNDIKDIERKNLTDEYNEKETLRQIKESEKRAKEPDMTPEQKAELDKKIAEIGKKGDNL